MNYKDLSLLCIDNGLFISFAAHLAKSFGQVFCWSPWVSAYPKSTPMLTGVGVPGVTRVNDFWQVIDDVDIIFFPDCYFGGLQEHLVSLGKRVWGGRNGDELELNRILSKQLLEAAGIDIGPYKVIRGMDALREYLKKNDNVYVKISATRGDMETFHSKNYGLVEPRLDEIEYKLGPLKKTKEFIVEEAIDAICEIGYDGYSIDGRFPKNAMWGVEIKDKGFIMQSTQYDKLPEPVRRVNDLMSDLLRGYHYRGFISSEVRVTDDGKAFAIDPCMRAGSPPSELYQNMITNWPDIIWGGAAGKLVEPVFAAKWGAELMLTSEWALQNWQAVTFPKSVADNVKLHHWTVMDGKQYCIPQFKGSSTIGAVVALGDTMEAAVAEARRIAEKVQGYYIACDTEALDKAEEELNKAKKVT